VPTPAEIAQLTADLAAAPAIDPAAMVRLLDVAIAFAVSQGDVVVSYNSQGQTVTRSLEQARALREYYAEEITRASARATPLVPLQAELP
jgi:hypothetical protein